jgi:hypothetical protein
MIHIPFPRLSVYSSILSKYDFTDKHTNFEKFVLTSCVPKFSCVILGTLKTSLNEILFNEFLTFKKLHFTSIKNNNKYKLNYFKITIRKKYLFLCVELLLNSSFVYTKLKILDNKKSYSLCNFKFPVISSINPFFSFSYIVENCNMLSYYLNLYFGKKISPILLQNCLFLPINYVGE